VFFTFAENKKVKMLEKIRLLPCTIFEMLVGGNIFQKIGTFSLMELINAMQRLPEDAVSENESPKHHKECAEWGCWAMRCALETESMQFTWKEVLLAIQEVLKAMAYHAEHKGVIREACLTLACCFQTTCVIKKEIVPNENNGEASADVEGAAVSEEAGEPDEGAVAASGVQDHQGAVAISNSSLALTNAWVELRVHAPKLFRFLGHRIRKFSKCQLSIECAT